MSSIDQLAFVEIEYVRILTLTIFLLLNLIYLGTHLIDLADKVMLEIPEQFMQLAHVSSLRALRVLFLT